MVPYVECGSSTRQKIKMKNKGAWIPIGVAIGAAISVATKDLVWIAVGGALGAGLGFSRPQFGKKDGPFKSYYRSGQLKEKGTYKDGELEGLSELYYKNGQLSEKGTYKDGEPHGPFEGYSKNGQLEWKGTYNMGEECGEWVEDGETVTYAACPPDLEGGN